MKRSTTLCFISLLYVIHPLQTSAGENSHHSIMMARFTPCFTNTENEENCWRTLIAENIPDKMYDFGVHYANGDGVKQDLTKGRYWIHQSALRGYPLAQYNLGVMFFDGIGGAQSQACANHWLNKASLDKGKTGEMAKQALAAMPEFILSAESSSPKVFRSMSPGQCEMPPEANFAINQSLKSEKDEALISQSTPAISTPPTEIKKQSEQAHTEIGVSPEADIADGQPADESHDDKAAPPTDKAGVSAFSEDKANDLLAPEPAPLSAPALIIPPTEAEKQPELALTESNVSPEADIANGQPAEEIQDDKPAHPAGEADISASPDDKASDNPNPAPAPAIIIPPTEIEKQSKQAPTESSVSSEANIADRQSAGEIQDDKAAPPADKAEAPAHLDDKAINRPAPAAVPPSDTPPMVSDDKPIAQPQVKMSAVEKKIACPLNIGGALPQATKGHYTLQLSSAAQPDSLEDLAKKNKLTNYLVYETERHGRRWFILVYGEYAGVTQAKQAILGLPPVFRKNTPWVRSLASVQAEL